MAAFKGRRNFLMLAGGAALAAPYLWRGQAGASRGRIVVIGGGAGGAVAARQLAQSGAGFDITLVEPKARYTTCFFSNRYIGGLQDIDSLTFGYERLAAEGITLAPDDAIAIDPEARTVRLSGGQNLAWDRLVVAPGIDFRWGAIEGYGPEAAKTMPHAWRAGEQSHLLRAQLEAMPDGGTFLISPPEEPYRCPSGPYERVSLVANYFARAKPKSKIVILDAKSEFPLQAQFEAAWASHYPGMIEVIPADFSGGPKAVDPTGMTVMSEDGKFRVDVANVIPPQMAGAVALEAGLADDSDWCPVELQTFESMLIPGIHVIGDSAIASPMPKAGYAASLQARISAGAILLSLTGRGLDLPDLGGACWSHIRPDNAIREYAEYSYAEGTLTRSLLDISPADEGDAERAASAQSAEIWYHKITQEMFGES